MRAFCHILPGPLNATGPSGFDNPANQLRMAVYPSKRVYIDGAGFQPSKVCRIMCNAHMPSQKTHSQKYPLPNLNLEVVACQACPHLAEAVLKQRPIL